MRDGPLVLVVDDDPEILEALSCALTVEGYTVDVASDGTGALDRLAGGARPGVILLDLMMPAMDGPTYLDVIASSAELSAIPVVVMTAAAVSEDTSTLPFPLLRKPFDYDALLHVIAGYCPRLWDDEAPTSERGALRSDSAPLGSDTCAHPCVACERQGSTRCAGCGQAFCKGCLDSGPDGLCVACWRAARV